MPKITQTLPPANVAAIPAQLNYPMADPHARSTEAVVHALQTDATRGLSQRAAHQRLSVFGPNVHPAQKQQPLIMVLLLQFKSPIVYLLFFAVALTLYFQNYMESIAILVVLLVNAFIGFFMELQARISMNALKKMDVMLTKVIRDGKTQDIPAEKIVPGDIVKLEAGDLIPGDGRVISANQLQCEEASLTGESLPTEKNTAILPKDTALAEQCNMVFKGTAVTNGNGKALITGTASHTQLGAITALVATAQPRETPLDKKISLLSKKLIWITLGMTAIFATTGFVQGKNWVLILETSIALAVAAFPEGLPIVSTVALAYGMLLMARRKAIVKKLSAVETLGSTNVILTDKTGTLTENKIAVASIAFPEETLSVSIKSDVLGFVERKLEKSESAFQKLILIGTLCNNAVHKKSRRKLKWTGDPIEIALMQLTRAAGLSSKTLKTENKRINEIPFSADTKVMATLHKTANGHFVAAKGAVEHLLAQCVSIQVGANVRNLSDADSKNILAASEKMAADGLRVLAFAYREAPTIEGTAYINTLVYVAMLGFIDPPRLDIKSAMLRCRSAGIRIVMITGDHPLTALNVAKKVGLVDQNEQNTISGNDMPEMESLSDEWVEKILRTAVFARTTPKQKLEIVSIYQNAGNIVAMAGDGVNDAPALKKADIGIAMGLRGTQVAKETASIVLKDDSFKSIVQAVAQGREIFQNIKKFVIYLVSCNLSEILIVTVLGFIAPASTLLPLQILFLNMVTDIFPALALGLGTGDKTVMQRPPRDPGKLIVSNRDWLAISIYAFAMTLAVIGAVLYCHHSISTDPVVVNNIAFYTLAFAQLFHVFNMSSVHAPLFVNDITKNKFVWMALVICLLLLAMVYVVSPLRLVLGLELLSTEVWIVSVLAGFMPLLLIQVYKIIVEWRSKSRFSTGYIKNRSKKRT